MDFYLIFLIIWFTKEKRAIAIKNSFRICGHKINVGLHFPRAREDANESVILRSRGKAIPCCRMIAAAGDKFDGAKPK